MVEELKLAIKVDDDAIEQSLLKQFANAEKMANKVVLTFNNIDLDDKAIEAKFKEMQKMAGKNPIDLSIDKSSIEMLSAISKQLGNIFDIAKGKSIIDSSATAQIDKLQSKLDELTKKYNELSSKKIGSTVSGKDIDLVDNTEFKRLSDEFSLLKDELTGLKREMQLFEEATVSADTFVAMERDVNGLIVKVDDLIDKYVQLSVAQKNIGTDKSNISSENITSAIESQNKIQEELKETQKQAEQTADGIITVYRGLKSSSDEMFDSTHLSAWFSDNLKSANSFAKGIGDVYKSQIKLDNPMIVDAKGANHESILYAETNEELQKAIKLQEELNAKRKEFSEKYGKYLETQDMSLLGNPSEYLKDGDVIDELEQKLSQYLKTTEQLQEIAKNGGYDGLIIKNIKDNYLSSDDNIGTSYAVFDKEKIISYERINYLKELEKQAEQTTKAVQDVSETPIKDVFQDDDKINTDASTTAIKEESRALEQVSTSAKDAATSKEKFANANKEVKASAESSSTSLNEEKKKFENVGDSAEETKKKLDDVVFKPNTEGFDEIVSKLDIAKDKIEEISKITKSSVWAESQGEYLESYNIKYKNGTSEIRGESSNKKGSNVLRANEVAYDAKAEEQAAKERLKSEQKVQAQKDAFHKKNLTAIDLEIQKREEESKMFSSALKAQMEERQKDISSMESSLKSFNESSKQLSAKPDDQHQFSSWKKQLEDLNIEIAEYKSKVENLSKIDIADEAQINKAKTEIEELGKSIKETINTMSKTPQAKRGWTDIGASKAAEKVANVLKQNTKMSKEARDAIRAYYNELRSGNPSQPIDEILVKVNQLVQKERELGRVGKSFGEIFKEKVIYGGAAQLAGMVGFYDVINVIRQAGEAVIDLNTNITELAKVSEASVSQIYDDFNSYADIAKEVGGTISDTISATADWSRNGYNIPDSKELAEVAMIYKNVGDGIDIDQANEYLISTLRGFSLEAKDAMDIIDSMNEVANNEPISSAGIGEALQRSAAAFNAANTSLQESIALVTSTNSVLQSPEKVGSMWTTVSARIRGATTELEEAGLETDGMVESTSKLQAMIKGMTGFDILESDGKTFKSIYDIIVGIGDEFQNLSDLDQAKYNCLYVQKCA